MDYVGDSSRNKNRLCISLAAGRNGIGIRLFVLEQLKSERKREFICHKITKKYKNILNKPISTVAGYQIGKRIKLVAYSTNYIKS